MSWNWQLPEWPEFRFSAESIARQEKKFLLAVGSSSAFLKKIEEGDHQQFVIEILSSEGEQSSRIEGEILDRQSLQSSIKKHFGLGVAKKPIHLKEAGMAELLYDVYKSYDKHLTHDILWEWHAKLFKKAHFAGRYRDHEEPMQIVGHRLDIPRVFFEAPPSKKVHSEMQRYIKWFNSSEKAQSILGKAAIAHLYFENIHPFEDGNGRIGRAIVEKSLSQGVGRPILIAVSKVLEKRRKEYYRALEACNQTLEATSWVEFFADAILQAQEESLNLLNFIIEKSKLLTRLAGKLNQRQEKVLLRMFQEGPNGFQGGLTAEKYITITGAPRATATRDLTELVELGALFKTGELRHTRYWLKIESSSKLTS
jgi:Fic family protein